MTNKSFNKERAEIIAEDRRIKAELLGSEVQLKHSPSVLDDWAYMLSKSSKRSGRQDYDPDFTHGLPSYTRMNRADQYE